MSSVVRIYVDGIPPRPNAQRREHWSKRATSSRIARDQAKNLALEAISLAGADLVLPIDPAALYLTFVLSAARGDLDGLVSAAKPLVDGLKDAGVIRDDNVSRVSRLIVGWKRGPGPGVWITVRPAGVEP